MASRAVKRFALDVNLVLDRAKGENFAIRLLKALQGQGYSFILPPTAFVELTLIAKTFEHPSKEIAITGLRSLKEWGIATCDLIPVGHGITELFARTLISRGLLPEEEFDDGLILAEASLMEVSGLLTSDTHLTGIDETTLKLVFEERDLPSVSVFHPRRLVQTLKKYRLG
jgi:hypothetical protein